jgi:thiol:disulfide interchange protein DsbD
MIKSAQSLPLIALLALNSWPVQATGQSSPAIRDQHVEAVVVGEMSHIQPGGSYRVGLLLRHDPGWHTYWKSTATGYATSIEWELPDGFSVSDLSWPTPQIYDFQGWTEYVYKGEVLLMATLQAPQKLDKPEVEIGFSAEWLMCENVCIPGGISSRLRLPVSESPPTPSQQWADVFRSADESLPAQPGPYGLEAWAGDRTVYLRVSGQSLPDSVHFFDDQGLLDPGPQGSSMTTGDGFLDLAIRLDESTDAVPERLTGVLKSAVGWPAADGRPSLAVDTAIRPGPPPTADSADSAGGLGAGMLAIAFIGGLILNLMPCVFPVLGIKIMGFVKQAGESRRRVVSHGLVFTSGVLISFWILATVLLVLRSGGSQLGWGFQLQSPGFVLALTLLLFAFGLNLSGLYEFGQSAVGVGSGLTGKSGLSGSFFSGILATVVATPCAAPFLAPALGVALALPAPGSLAVFTAIALGLSAPYLLLSAFPGLVRWLPRPGAWMETFKQFMGFLLYATVAYLVWVLAGQLTEEGGYTVFSMLKVLMSLVGMALALWIYGRWAAFHRPRKARLTALGISVLLLAGALWIGFSGTVRSDTQAHSLQWEEWAPGKAESYAQAGRVVYVDFTARWCVTCQTNKAAVFSSKKVRKTLEQLDVVLLKADWTNQDPEISRALAGHSRSAVPFNLVYGPGRDEPLVLPEILTPGIVLDAIDSVKPEI